MNLKKLCKAGLSLAGCLFLAAAAHAQTPQIVAVGSSALFPSVVVSMTTADPITHTPAPCGTNVWTTKNATYTYGIDGRTAYGVPNEAGTLAIVWDSTTTVGDIICAYLSTDSVVGQRLFLGTGSGGNGTLFLATGVSSIGGAGAVSYLSDSTTGPPAAVVTALQGAHFNVAFTDIRPEDGEYAYQRASCSRSGVTDPSCFGYGPVPIGTNPIQSSYTNGNYAYVMDYAISGTDPIDTSVTVGAFTTVPIGISPVILFYNTYDTGTGGLGALLPSNITDDTVVGVWSGLIGTTNQISNNLGGSGVNLHVVQREPVSGTYNTFEWQLVHTRDHHAGDFTQEYNFGPTPVSCFTPPNSATYVPPATACANPANVNGVAGPSYGGYRTRAIGTGEMVSAVSSSNNPDSIGYAFWGLSTFGGKANLHYLSLNGQDPLYANGTVLAQGTQNFPSCSGKVNLGSFSCSGNTLPTFTNIQNGSYRVWSLLRAIYYTSYTPPGTGPSIAGLIQAAQDQAESGGIPDFLPYQYCSGASCTPGTGPYTANLQVVRSHYPLSGYDANNGTNGPSSFCAADQTAPNCIEEGGDMAGKVFLRYQDVVYYGLTSNEYLTWIE